MLFGDILLFLFICLLFCPPVCPSVLCDVFVRLHQFVLSHRFIIFFFFSFFLSFQAYISYCFSLMYDTESEEKHLDFIATSQPMVSLAVFQGEGDGGGRGICVIPCKGVADLLHSVCDKGLPTSGKAAQHHKID